MVRITYLYLAIVVAVTMITTADAGTITLRKVHLGKLEFSKGDSSFVNVGRGCKNLKLAMVGDSLALANIQKYNDKRVIATLDALSGCVLAAFPLNALFHKDWETGYAMCAVGAGALIVSSFFVTASAEKHLSKAVDGYNERHGETVDKPTATFFPTMVNRRAVGIGISIQF